MQDAVQQALRIWVRSPVKGQSEPLSALEGSLADVDIESLMHEQEEAEQAKDQRWS